MDSAESPSLDAGHLCAQSMQVSGPMPKTPREEGEATEPAVSLPGDADASDASTSEGAAGAEHTPVRPKSSEATNASTSGEEAPLHHTPLRPQSDIDLCRRVVPLIEVSDDCCPICLDEYTQADPGVPTTCGHSYHLQCVMQWAQRSRECPLCFKTLRLQDEEMNGLLPFGEYVSPEQEALTLVDVESWELERLLLRLAAAGSRHERHGRSERHRSGGRRHGGSASARGEASAPQPIAGGPRRTDPGAAAVAATSPGAYPSSWPPAEGPSSSRGGGLGGLFGGRAGGTSGGGEAAASPAGRPSSLKSKFASLRLKTVQLFSPSSTGGGSSSGRGADGSGGGGSSTAAM